MSLMKQIQNIIIHCPLYTVILFHSGNGNTGKYDECSYYNLNYTNLISQFNGEYDAILNYVQKNLTYLKTLECSEWIFDTSIYSSTIASEVIYRFLLIERTFNRQKVIHIILIVV